jgi:hypothetical protein
MLAMAERQNQIGSLLNKRGMTIYGLAKALQMPHHNIKRIVDSPVIPDGTSYKTLRMIAEALGVGIDDLEVKEE